MAKSGKENGLVECSSGVFVTTKPISVKLLELFELNHRQPDPPSIEATVVGGEVELVPNPDDPEYVEVMKEFNRKTTDDFLAMILDLGVEFDMPNDNTWKNRLQRMGITVPEDSDEARQVYIQTFVMTDFLRDLQIIAASVLKKSGVGEEAIASWVALF